MSLLARTPSTCKGLRYRYEVSSYLDKRGSLVTTTRWVKLKRLSCRGCEECVGYDLASYAKDAGDADVEIKADRLLNGHTYAIRWVHIPPSGPDFIDEGDGYWSATCVSITPPKKV